MKILKFTLIFICIIISWTLPAKNFFEMPCKQQKQSDAAVISAINTLFEGMENGDPDLIKSVLLPEARMQTITQTEEGIPRIVEESGSGFIKAIEEKKPEDSWNEKLWNYDVMIDGIYATVRTPYTFYFNEQRSHCGVNVFQLYLKEGNWMIFAITDTRRKDNCTTPQDKPKEEVSKAMDKWHRAAAKADTAFFDFMTPDAIYIGTDATERWTKEEFLGFALPYFKRGKAWDFKTLKRDVYLSGNGNLAWFEESLDTWMGECRASGVLKKIDNQWKIAHYHLSVTVPNDLIKEFIGLIGN